MRKTLQIGNPDYCNGYNKAWEEAESEIDRLRADKLLADEHYWEARNEIDRLRAENERLRLTPYGECYCSDDGCTDPLPANCPKRIPEIDRLRAELADQKLMYDSLSEGYTRLRKEGLANHDEIDRLRAALIEAVDYLSTIGAREYCPKANAILAKTAKEEE